MEKQMFNMRHPHKLSGFYIAICWLVLIFISTECSPAARSSVNLFHTPQNTQNAFHPEIDQSKTPDNNDRINADRTASETLNSQPQTNIRASSKAISETNRRDRQSRCLVEAILYSRALSHENLSKNRNKPALIGMDAGQKDGSIRRAKRNRDSRILTYITLNNADWLPPPYLSKQNGQFDVVQIEPDVRPMIFYTPNGLKVWGSGSESKFPPLLEYIVQRIQTYYSVYKYEDLSRPGFDWTLKPIPKPFDPALTPALAPAQ